ncbi:MAG: caspase family protein [Saprospiraceae bacterium]
MSDFLLPFEKSHAFIIGINDYMNTTSLVTAVPDALAIQAILEKHGYEVHPPLLNEDATKENIEKLMGEEIPGLLGPKDRLIFYFAGHGIAFDSDDDPKGYLVPVDADLDQTNSLVSMDFLREKMANWNGQHGLLIMDCCFAGAIRWSIGLRAIRRNQSKVIYEERFLRYTSDPAWQVITSASADQEAVDVLNKLIGSRPSDSEGHSPFATALKEALEGAADFEVLNGQKDGIITASELYIYLRDRVQELTSGLLIKQTPAIFNLLKHDKGEYMFINPDPSVVVNLPPFPARNPYLGLATFEEEDALFFFGREKAIMELYEMVKQHPLVIVTAGSGMGKSSLVKAGLIPQFRAANAMAAETIIAEGANPPAGVNASDQWNILPVVRSGQDPLESLETLLPDWEQQLQSGKNVLIIDQYEEVLSNGLSAQKWMDFETKIATFLSQEQARLDSGKPASLRVVFTVRSDYELLLHGLDHPLAPWWTKGRFVVPPFTQEELYDIIARPAHQSVLFFEPADFPFTLVNEIDRAPGALPLLSFVLSTLYQSYVSSTRTDRHLLASDYLALGGMIGVLSSQADKVFDALDEAHQQTMKKIILRMLKIENGKLVRRKVPFLPFGEEKPASTEEGNEGNKMLPKRFNELDFPNDEQDRMVEKVRKRLVKEQLAVITKDEKTDQPFLEPAHDALINFWPKCLRWIQEFGPSNIVLQRLLWSAVTDYLSQEDIGAEGAFDDFITAASHLWDKNPKLDELKAIVDSPNNWLNKAETDFVKKSWNQKNEIVQRLRKERDEARSAALAAKGLITNQVNPTRAYNLAMHAYQTAPISETCQAVLEISSDPNNRFYKRFSSGQSRISSVAFSPNGAHFVLGIEDNEHPVAILYELDGKEKTVFEGHRLKVLSVAFSPDGQQVLTGSHDGTAKLWDLEGNVIKTFAGAKGHTGPIFAVAFSPKPLANKNSLVGAHSHIVLTGSADGTAKLWDLEPDSDPIQDFQVGGIVWSAAFSPQGNQVLTAGEDKKARLWDLNAQLIQTFETEGHTNRILSVAMSKDEAYVLTGGADARAILWENTGKKFFEVEGHTAQVNSVCFSPSGTHLMTVGQDGKAILGLLVDYKPQVFTDQGQSFSAATFTPDSKSLLIACRDGRYLYHDLQGMNVATFPDHGFGISPVLFHPGGDTLFIGSKNNAGLMVDLEGAVKQTFEGHSSSILSAAFSENGQLLLTGSMDQSAKLWDLEAGGHRTFSTADGIVWAVALSKDGQRIYTAGENQKIERWTDEAAPDQIVGSHMDRILSIALSDDETHLLSGGGDQIARYWNLETGVSTTLKGHTGEIWSVAISPNNQWLLTGATDKTAILWTKDGTLVRKLTGHGDEVHHVCFSPDNRFILTTSNDKTAILWNLEGQKLQSFKGHRGNVWTACFSPDGRWIATKGIDETVKLWHNYLVAWEREWMEYLTEDEQIQFGVSRPNLMAAP